MLRRLVFIGVFWLLSGSTAFAEGVRYFTVWDFLENAPAEEIRAEDRSGRKLGYWELQFDGDNQVLGGVYRGADGAAWLSIRYVVEEERIYADVFGPDGEHRRRKATNLSNLRPVWPSTN